MLVLLSLVIAAGSWWWLYAHGQCGKSRVRDGVLALNSAQARWTDTAGLAVASSRMSIDQHISKLQEIRRDVDALALPPCLGRSKALLVENMNQTIEYLTGFMGGEDQASAAMRTLGETVKTSGESYTSEVKFVGRCDAPAWMPECAGH